MLKRLDLESRFFMEDKDFAEIQFSSPMNMTQRARLPDQTSGLPNL